MVEPAVDESVQGWCERSDRGRVCCSINHSATLRACLCIA